MKRKPSIEITNPRWSVTRPPIPSVVEAIVEGKAWCTDCRQRVPVGTTYHGCRVVYEGTFECTDDLLSRDTLRLQGRNVHESLPPDMFVVVYEMVAPPDKQSFYRWRAEAVNPIIAGADHVRTTL